MRRGAFFSGSPGVTWSSGVLEFWTCGKFSPFRILWNSTRLSKKEGPLRNATAVFCMTNPEVSWDWLQFFVARVSSVSLFGLPPKVAIFVREATSKLIKGKSSDPSWRYLFRFESPSDPLHHGDDWPVYFKSVCWT